MAIPAWLFTPEERAENRRRSLTNFFNAIPEHLAEEARCNDCAEIKKALSEAGVTHTVGVCDHHKAERWRLTQDFFV